MKKNSTKGRFGRRLFLSALGLFAVFTVTVYAGDINSAEQRIVNYYNGTFEYEGKTYVATEAAKQSVYNKLTSDDVNLTESEARTAIRRASQSIAEGIEKGYLVEAVKESDTENVTETETEGEQLPEEKENADSTETTTGNPTDDAETSKQGDAEKENVGTENRKNEPEYKPDKDTRKVDIERVVKRAKEDENHNHVYTADENFLPEIVADGSMAGSVTVEQYAEGLITATLPDGTLLFESGLPVKNTGYSTQAAERILWGAGALLALTCTVGCGCIVYEYFRRKAEGTDKMNETVS